MRGDYGVAFGLGSSVLCAGLGPRLLSSSIPSALCLLGISHIYDLLPAPFFLSLGPVMYVSCASLSLSLYIYKFI